mmetsp:Transcript_95503/g.270105  ORF Transcript_95503/g.270105 Transcript_95503/m.270105 type:complete len:246 (+) Transcript_95503:941-1678(+)
MQHKGSAADARRERQPVERIVDGLEGLLPEDGAELVHASAVKAEETLHRRSNVLANVLVVASIQPHRIWVADLQCEQHRHHFELMAAPIDPIAVEHEGDTWTRQRLQGGSYTKTSGHQRILFCRLARPAIEVEKEEEVAELTVHIPKNFGGGSDLGHDGLLLQHCLGCGAEGEQLLQYVAPAQHPGQDTLTLVIPGDWRPCRDVSGNTIARQLGSPRAVEAIQSGATFHSDHIHELHCALNHVRR